MLLRRAGPLAVLLSLPLAWLAWAQGEPRPAGPSNVGEVLKESLEAQVAALNAEDPDRVMALFHPDADGREQAQRNLVAMFRANDLRYSLDRYVFVAVDEPYAYARVVQTTRGAGPQARSSEQLFVFRRHLGEAGDGGWRFWTSVVLDTVPPPAPDGR